MNVYDVKLVYYTDRSKFESTFQSACQLPN